MAVKQQKSLKLNFIMNAILTMSQFIFPLITFPYVSRILLPDGTGIQMSSSHDITLTPQEQALIMRLKSFHSLITSEKVVPILCRRGQKFSVLYKLSVFSVHTIVKHN